MEHQGSLAGAVGVVTGGGQGIGRAICERLAEDGCRVAVWDIDVDAAAETRQLLGSDQDMHLAVSVDIAESEAVANAYAETRRLLGPASVLVNNAAWSSAHPSLPDVTDEQWERTLAVNLSGAFRCTRAVAPDMIASRSGSIVNIAAMTALTGLRTASAPYAASKGGVIALTYAAAAQFAASGIRVNAVVPGTTDTPRSRAMPEDRRAQLYSQILLRPSGGEPRVAEPGEIAEAVWFLASPRSSWITGTSIVCSGGQFMR